MRKRCMITTLSLAGHWLKDNQWILGYAHTCTFIWHLNHIEAFIKWKFWNKSQTTLCINATITRKEIEMKPCFEHLFSVRLFPCTASANLQTRSLVARIQGVAKYRYWGQKFCSTSLTKNGDWLNENLSGETFSLRVASTLDTRNYNNTFFFALTCTAAVLLTVLTGAFEAITAGFFSWKDIICAGYQTYRLQLLLKWTCNPHFKFTSPLF